MKSRYYKIKKKDSNQFWSGYSSQFTKNGTEFLSLDDVGISLYTQMSRVTHQAPTLWDWVETAEIIEYEVILQDTGAYNAASIIKLTKLYRDIKQIHGDSFLKGYKSIVTNINSIDLFKYAVKIDSASYTEFKISLKDLGYSSRHFKKTGSWIWFNSDDLGFRIKLISGCISFVDLSDYITQFRQLYIKTPVGELVELSNPTEHII